MPAWVRGIVFVCLSLFLPAAGANAAAVATSATTYAPVCHAASDETTTLIEMAAAGARWHCGAGDWDNTRPAAWLRFDAAAWRGAAPPTSFVSHITRFQRISLSAVDADGSTRTRTFTSGEAELLESGPLFAVPLPELGGSTREVIVRLERPHNVTALTEARLSRRPHLAAWQDSAVVLLAMIAGMLLIPLVFDIGLYTVLRERFLLLHAGMVGSMLGYLLFSGGLVLFFAKPQIDIVSVVGPLSFAVGAWASAYFLLDFLEDNALPPTMRRLLVAAGWWSLLVPGTMALQLDAMQPFDNEGYFYGFVPPLAVFAATLITALLRGSRAVRLVAVAWIPILACCAERILRGTGVYSAPASLDQLMFLAFAIEVIVVWTAVILRFMRLKQERDKARDDARMLGELSERDPLTGLLNRRGIERRFAALHGEGYETFAVLDLDRFKEVNDRFGHAVGDDVLRACARALSVTPNLFAARMGGEEFLLLLRGADSLVRAEEIRRELSARVAREVAGLDRFVTASMGVVQIPREVIPDVEFAAIYDRADQLLYAAKAAGRNRSMSEKLSLFPRPGAVPAAA